MALIPIKPRPTKIAATIRKEIREERFDSIFVFLANLDRDVNRENVPRRINRFHKPIARYSILAPRMNRTKLKMTRTNPKYFRWRGVNLPVADAMVDTGAGEEEWAASHLVNTTPQFGHSV